MSLSLESKGSFDPSSRRWRLICAALLLLFITFVFLENKSNEGGVKSLVGSQTSDASHRDAIPAVEPEVWSFNSERDERNLGLRDEQCDTAFPGLYAELERARDFHRARGGINISQIEIWTEEPGAPRAQTRVILYNGNLHIVGDKQGFARRERVGSALSNLNRAIQAIPDPRKLPNIEFTMDTLDDPNPRRKGRRPGRTVWGWDRHVSDDETWVMPDFGGWSYVGGSYKGGVMGYNSFREGVEHLERELEAEAARKGIDVWELKTNKALWRGSSGLGNDDAPHSRQELIEVSKGKEWSDVQGDHFVQQVDHCRWQYLVHTEGYAWGGRLRYLMNCASAVIIPWPLHFAAHFYPLLQPDGPEQNFIPVKPDWSDLNATMEHYANGHSHFAAHAIATRAAATFHDRYLTPAAEACYLRRLITLYASVQNFEPKLWADLGSMAEDGSILTDQHEKQEGTVSSVMRGFDWEYFSYRAPCHRDPIPGLDKGAIDFEE